MPVPRPPISTVSAARGRPRVPLDDRHRASIADMVISRGGGVFGDDGDDAVGIVEIADGSLNSGSAGGNSHVACP